VTLGSISVTGDRGLRLQLPPVADLVSAFGKVGVTDTSRIIVYAGSGGVQSATRVWFTLDYLGLSERASMLDGGMVAWRAGNRPVSTEAVPPAAGTFTARPRENVVVDAAWIQANAKSVNLVDARTPEFFTGASAGSMPRGGHIPGARNVPYNTLLDEAGRFRSADQLRTMLGDSKNVVTYCHIGQQATVPYFVARLLGLDVKLYDGSFQDWSSRPELPVGKP
jgi:thiosulfate/3-mercaptopyruvate sulfurtransferase